MAVPTLQQLLSLDVETRLELVQQLWNSIVEDANAGADLPLTAEMRTALDERLAEDDQSPADAIPWSEVRSGLRRDR